MTRAQRSAWVFACLVPILIGAVYVGQFAMSFPRWDQLETSIYAVEGALDGTLTFADLTQPNYGHRIITSLATSAALARLTSWNLLVEAYIGYALLVATYVALAATLRAAEIPNIPLAAFMLAVVIFSLRNRTNLIWSFTALQWFYMTLFIALAGWAFIARPVGWPAYGLVVVFTALAIASSAGGIALLGIFPVLFYFRGYRKLWHYLVWGGFLALTLWLYTYGQAVGENNVSPLEFEPVQNFWFLVTWVSSAFVPKPITTPRVVHLAIAGAGLGLVAANAVLIIRQRGTTSRTVIWLAFLVGYGLSIAVLTMLGRTNSWWAGAQSRFYAMSGFFWAGAALSAVVVVADGRTRGLWRSANGVALVLIVAGQIMMTVTQFTMFHPEGLVGNLKRERDERCYWVYLLDRSPTCLSTLDHWGVPGLVPTWNNLFERRLTLYAAYDDMNPIDAIMPDIYRDGEPVVIAGPEAHQQVRGVVYDDLSVPGRLQVEPPFAQTRMHVPPPDLFRVLAADVPANPELFRTAGMIAAGTTPDAAALDAFRFFVRVEPRVWYLRADAPDAFDAPFREALAETHAPLRVEGVHWRTTGYEDVTLWTRKPTVAVRFGADFVLEDWQLTRPDLIVQCGTIEVKSMWRTEAPLPENYTFALVLVDATGIGQARADVDPAGYTPRLMEPGVHYAGTNTMRMSCEVGPGRYDLLAGVYLPGTGEALPATDAAGNPMGDLAYLTTITIE